MALSYLWKWCKRRAVQVRAVGFCHHLPQPQRRQMRSWALMEILWSFPSTRCAAQHIHHTSKGSEAIPPCLWRTCFITRPNFCSRCPVVPRPEAGGGRGEGLRRGGRSSGAGPQSSAPGPPRLPALAGALQPQGRSREWVYSPRAPFLC